MLFFIYLIRYILKKGSNHVTPDKKPKFPNKFWLFIVKLCKKIFTRKFLYSFVSIFITGLLARYCILNYFGVNVFTDIYNKISLCYYAFMSLHINFVRAIAETIQPNYMMPAGGGNPPVGNPPVGNPTGGNPPVGNQPVGNQPVGNQPVPSTGIGGNLRANKYNGPIDVADPDNQNYRYNVNGTNQPLLGNIARVLDHQRSIGVTSLTRFVFTRQQEGYILTFLYHNHRDVYDNLMRYENETHYTDKPI